MIESVLVPVVTFRTTARARRASRRTRRRRNCPAASRSTMPSGLMSLSKNRPAGAHPRIAQLAGGHPPVGVRRPRRRTPRSRSKSLARIRVGQRLVARSAHRRAAASSMVSCTRRERVVHRGSSHAGGRGCDRDCDSRSTYCSRSSRCGSAGRPSTGSADPLAGHDVGASCRQSPASRSTAFLVCVCCSSRAARPSPQRRELRLERLELGRSARTRAAARGSAQPTSARRRQRYQFVFMCVL